MNLKDIKVLADNILVEPIQEEEKVGELIKPVWYEDRAYQGKVVKTGKDVKDIGLGQIVFFNKYAATVFPFNGKEYLVLKVEDIIAVLDSKLS